MRWTQLSILAVLFSCGDLQGPPGERGDQGEEGPQGAKGDPGDAGIGGSINTKLYCGGPLPTTPLYYEYTAAVTSHGDVMAVASVRDGSFQIGGVIFYARNEPRGLTAPVIFSADFLGTASAGYWEIGVDRITPAALITYRDIDVPGGMLSWAPPAEDCRVTYE